MTEFASRNTDRAIKELERALPLTALHSIIERRTAQHKPRADLRQTYVRMKADQLASEAS